MASNQGQPENKMHNKDGGLLSNRLSDFSLVEVHKFVFRLPMANNLKVGYVALPRTV
jgi:hypothetical protein